MSDWRTQRDALLLTLENSRSAALRAEAADQLCDLAEVAPLADLPEFAAVITRLLADAQTEIICAGLAMATLALPRADAIAIQTRHLTHAIERVRVEAAGRIADFADPGARGALAAALQDPSDVVRFEGARGMAELKHASGFEVLVEALHDAELRFRAAAALARLGKPEAIPPLKKLFGQWMLPAFDRTQVAGALAHLGDAEGLAHLIKRAEKKRWSMDRAMALELLGDAPQAEAKSLLLKVAADAKDGDRGVAARALGRHKDAATLTLYRSLLDGADENLKLDVAWGLSFLGTDEARALRQTIKVEAAESQAELTDLFKEYP